MTEEFEVLVNRRALLGEGPLWDTRRERLYWVDILRRELHTFDPSSGDDHVVVLPAEVGAVALTCGRELVAAAGLGFAVVDPDSGGWRDLAGVEVGDRMNDGACDPRGRFLAGTLTRAREPGGSALYRLENDGAVRVVDGLTLSNGIGWSPDESIMYLVDTTDRTIWSFSYDPRTGEIADRRPWVKVGDSQGNPDGLAVDAEGGVWVAMHWSGRIHRYRRDGVLDTVVTAPTQRVTSLAFGGPDLGDLYVTSACFSFSEQQLVDDPHAGGLFRFRPGVTGLASTRWEGV